MKASTELNFHVVVEQPGKGLTKPIMPVVGSPRWSSAAVGGFGSASFDVPYRYYDEFVWLAKVRVYDGTQLLWEGRVEDRSLNISSDEWTVSVKCFGFQRLLQENSVRRIWLLRSIPWRASWKIGGSHSPGGGTLATISGVLPVLRTDTMFCTVGQFDPNDLTRVGIFINNNSGAATANGHSNWAVYVAPEGISIVRFKATATGALPGGGGSVWFAEDSVDSTTWTALIHNNTVGTSVDQATTSGARFLLLGVAAVGLSNFGIWEDIRILCTSIDEDTSGAMYGGTIMRDLIALVPGLGVGDIDSGSDFGIQSIARPVRDSIVSVVGEIASYYTKEWGVWEGGQFDWKELDQDTPHWVVELEDITGGSIDASIQGVTKTIYIVYENAATGEPEEQDAVSTDIRNPYVKEGQSADEVLSAPVVMLPNSGQKLADNLIVDHGGFPSVRGRITVPANRLIAHHSSGLTPACWMRGGENVYIPGLPRDDWMNHGRDGQTLFHITAVDTDMKSNSTSIEFEGYTRRGDVLLARIAAVTRTITG